MQIIIRQESEADYEQIDRLLVEAFAKDPHSDHREHILVRNLRKTAEFISALSLVAVNASDQVVGYILLSLVSIDNQYPTLALAPVAVLPEYQRKGIGEKLILRAHEEAVNAGFTSVVLLGHADYYPRFGYVRLENFGIEMPFDVPAEYCMGIELCAGALKHVKGTINYSKPFFE